MSPPRLLLRFGWAFHKVLFRATGGRYGTRRAGDGLGTLFLLSTGRTSGTVRRNGLYYIDDGSNLVVVASNAGADVDPGWWRNLQVTPEAEVELGTTRLPVRARAATADEAARIWPRFDARYPEYVAYRAKVTRDIPLVVLEPREPGSASRI
jgi:deazaflavin-dependent oxidoreductase (nitroreductase family)